VQTRKVHYGFAIASFLIALVTYTLTMQPTIPFWDCGEFAAAAFSLGVPHPPGAPLWTIIGRLGMLIPTFTDPVARYNFLSVLSSALSILLLYLTIVRLIKMFRGAPKNTADMLTTFGGAFVGALAYAFTDSFWFNALECEVYAFGSLFISLVPWLILVWHDHADEPHSEKYLLLIAYVIGLSLGVHQLALLTIFPVWMLVYYKRWPKTTVKGWFLMVLSSVVAFALIFKIVLSDLVDWAGKGNGIISLVILVGVIVGIFWSQQKKKPMVNLALWATILIFLGYTSYTLVMVRAHQDPPMNQGRPTTFEKLAGYINREQYGEARELPRRLKDQERDHANTWQNYSSDWDFFIRYQTNMMFHRYLGWNFIGRTTDDQGAGVDLSKTWALPFILGVFGMFWHFRRDPKRALTILGTFIIMGYLTDWYQNQQDPQPRERDYFYVGAFYFFAMWIGIGATGIMEWVRNRKSKAAESDVALLEENPKTGLVGGILIGLLVLVPINMCIGLAGLVTGQPFSQSSKWAEYSRAKNYIPWDYAYNILQSCDQDAILFTYGDNDTFPLWCLQDVYGIRRDIRIVQLSLANLPYYVKLLKNDHPWGAKTITLPSYSNEVLDMPEQEGMYAVPIRPKEVVMNLDAKSVQWIMGDSSASAAVMHWSANPRQPSEQLIVDIIENHLKDRPIYFSATVAEGSYVGLGKFLVHEGMAARVTPIEQAPDQTQAGLGGSINEKRYLRSVYHIPSEPHLGPDRGMILRTYNDPDSHHSMLDDRYSMSYRIEYIRLANYYLARGNKPEASRALDTLDARIPNKLVPLEYPYSSILVDLYDRVGNYKKSAQYARYTADLIREVMKDPNWRDNDPYAKQMRVDFTFGDMLLRAGEYDSAAAQFESLRASASPQEAGYFAVKGAEAMAMKLESQGKKKEAYDGYHVLLTQIASQGGDAGRELPEVLTRHDALAKMLGLPLFDPASAKALAPKDSARISQK
jgi:hypothetical protein